MRERKELDHAHLLSILKYDPQSGTFVWLVSKRGPGAKVGARAGSFDAYGKRWTIRISGRLFFAHRLAWFYMTGRWPAKEIDHINCDATDNRWQNLREATRGQNAANTRLSRRNTSGTKGVFRDKRRNNRPWYAQIQVDGQCIGLGSFSTQAEASNAYARAAADHFGEFARAW